MQQSALRPSSLAALATLAVAALCLWFARAGLLVSFTSDDLMNIFQAEKRTFFQTFLDNIFYTTGAYRPLGSLVYRILFRLFGLNALPYRLFCFGLILGNIFLLYRTAASIATRESAGLAALFASFNAGFAELYLNSGTLYDLLCFCFYFAALSTYLRIRNAGRHLSSRQLAYLLLLYICALNSKEAAVTFPIVIVLYELLLAPPGNHTLRRWSPAAVSAAMTIPYAWAKLSANSALAGNDAYRLHLGLRTYLRAFGRFLVDLACLPPVPNQVTVAVALLAILILTAALSRRRSLSFLVFFLLLTPLPVAFISYRSAYAMYIPSFGLFLFLAIVLTQLRALLARALVTPGPLLPQAQRLLHVDTFVFTLMFLSVFHASHSLPRPSPDQKLIQSVLPNMSAIASAKLTDQAGILFLNDPFSLDSNDLTYLVKLARRSPELTVHRLKTMLIKPDAQAVMSYDALFTFQGHTPVPTAKAAIVAN